MYLKNIYNLNIKDKIHIVTLTKDLIKSNTNKIIIYIVKFYNISNIIYI